MIIKKNIFLFLILLLLQGWVSAGSYNIKIQNSNFIKLINAFKDTAIEYTYTKKFSIISVGIHIRDTDTIINLYAGKRLKPDHFIGNTKIHGINVFFYSEVNKSIPGFFIILSKPQIKLDTAPDESEVYIEMYKFENGNFTFFKP